MVGGAHGLVRTRPVVLAVLAGVVALTAGCGAVAHISSGTFTAQNEGIGKTLFQQKCSPCHTLADAKAVGTIGPNLDDAFATDKLQGFNESTIADVVRGQIAYPDTNPGVPNSPGMTANLLHGQQARDVAVYVAACASNPHCGINPQPVGSTPG